ncbi:MAG TPA: bifunctional nuclease domain-containing protein [Anaeromyxobacter sp.]|nr:bifunctional nuclease domain-containing protein [Anaeromyxobacter sp.]
MRHAAPAGFVAVPLAIFVGTVFAASAAARAAPGDRVELELAGVLPMPEGSAGILVLREKGKETILPLVVPDGRRFAPGRVREPGLLRDTIEALGGRLDEVEIDQAEEADGGARVRLTRGGERVELRAVPSDSIALAVAAGVPIVTTRRLLDEAGLTPEDLARVHARAGKAAAIRL